MHASLLATFLAFYSTIYVAASQTWNPAEYSKKTATCKALKRDSDDLVDINLRYVEINPEATTTMIMVHGWPGLWSIWSYQIQEFKDDYRLIIPDLRGFGESTHPGDVQSSGTMGDLVGDLVCILEHANVQSAICVGHDWGSQVCYEAARMRPDIFIAVVGAVVPYIPAAGPFVPIKHLTLAFPKLTYQLFFEGQTDKAVAELDQDIRRSIRATLRTKASSPPVEFLKSPESFLVAWSHVEELPPVPFFTPEEEDYFIQQFSIQGFKHTLQFYTHENRYKSWNFAHTQGNYTISQPVLAIFPIHDPVADWVLASSVLKSADFLPHLTTELLGGGHWVHLENPHAFNDVVRKWLQKMSFDPKAPDTRAMDEL